MKDLTLNGPFKVLTFAYPSHAPTLKNGYHRQRARFRRLSTSNARKIRPNETPSRLREIPNPTPRNTISNEPSQTQVNQIRSEELIAQQRAIISLCELMHQPEHVAEALQTGTSSRHSQFNPFRYDGNFTWVITR